jgi:hypothetical protein
LHEALGSISSSAKEKRKKEILGVKKKILSTYGYTHGSYLLST